MKSISISLMCLLVIGIVMAGCAAKSTPPAAQAEAESTIETVTLKVDGLKCGNCVKAVQTQLGSVEGVTEATLSEGTAVVKGSPKVKALFKAVADSKSCCPSEFSAELASQ